MAGGEQRAAIEPGGTIPPLRSSMDRMAMVLLRAPDEHALDTRLKTVRDTPRPHFASPEEETGEKR